MEDLLHYVWKFRLFQAELRTTCDEIVEIVDVGISNTNGGPDFFNAKLKINGEFWAGNIEIHQKSTDWQKHGHDKDPNYNSVILHVVEKVNCEVYDQLGRVIPQCEIIYPTHIADNYEYLIANDTDIACSGFIATIPPVHLNSWMYSLLIERLERKAGRITELLGLYRNSWEDVFYVLLSRNLGFGLNSDPFERLARSLPLIYIKKQRDNIVQLEALLFGQAGLLNQSPQRDAYGELLQKEYDFLRNKYQLQALDSCVFQKMRVRPTASPHIRVAQLAALLHSSEGIFSKAISITDLGQLRLLFHVNASEYWQTHYQFGVVSEKKSKYLGDGSLDIILINTVVPLLFSYGRFVANEDICERAMFFLEQIKAEKNTITKAFSRYGIPLSNAADSQAIIQLKREYCERRKCLYCRIGHKLLLTPKRKI